MNGQSIQLMSYASEMQNGIFGAPAVGNGTDVIDMYDDNPLNGSDFELLQVNVTSPAGTPITTIPLTLVPYIPYDEVDATVNRTLVFDTIRLLPSDVPNLAEGPFGFNNETFHMDSINEIVRLNSQEIWTLKNNTLIAHPFHIHDIQFNIIEKNGTVPPLSEQGWKDVVLVMPQDSVKFITKFTTFTDDMVPYMYHCHLLHHEDDGMMGAFLVVNPDWGIDETEAAFQNITVSPNPSSDFWTISYEGIGSEISADLFSITGEKVFEGTFLNSSELKIPSEGLKNGVYFLRITDQKGEQQIKLMKAD
jgi:bilirubin oxidase